MGVYIFSDGDTRVPHVPGDYTHIHTCFSSGCGAQSLNDFVPLIYNASVVMLGVGMMAIGAAGFAGRGPMGGGR